MKKLLALLLSVTLACSVIGCSSNVEEEPKDNEMEHAENVDNSENADDTESKNENNELTIGVQIWSTDDALGGNTKRILDEAGKVWDVKFQFSCPEYSSEAQIKAIEDFIAAGVDGIMSVSCDEDTSVLSAEKCEKAGIPFVNVYRNVTEEELVDELRDNAAYLGEIANSDYQMGYDLIQHILDDGIEKIAFIDTTRGNANDVREDGMRAAMEDNGAKFVAVSTLSDSYEAAEGSNFTENILNVYPDTEMIVLSCGSNGIIDATLAKIETMGYGETCQVASVDAPVDSEGYIESGILYAVGGLIHNSAYYGAVLLVNDLQGNPLSDSMVQYPQVQPLIYGAKDAATNQKHMIDGLPYTEEEMFEMLVTNNPEYKLQDLLDEGNSFTLERLAQKFEQ